MNQHTPGPWSYRKCGSHWNNPGLERIEINYGEHGECIADTVYREADARLITAAPAMLEALRWACSTLGEESLCGGSMCEACIINKAIESAEGKDDERK